MPKSNASDTDATPPTDETRDAKALQREAYGRATSRVRENHRDEFNDYMVEECKARGITWTPPLSAQAKAQRDLDDLIAKNPELESLLRERFAQDVQS
jgi:hypothetical protein